MTTLKKTPEQEQKVVELYEELKSSAKVAEVLKISSQTVLNILDRNGVERQRKPKHGSAGVKICKKCGRKSENKDAHFCYYCGTDLRSTLQIALTDYEVCVRGVLKFAPPEMADEAIKKWNGFMKEMYDNKIIA